MARDADVNAIVKWATTGGNNDSSLGGLTRAEGWPDSYSMLGSGDLPRRETFNQLFRELSGAIVELNERGVLGWNSAVAYTHRAYTAGSDGYLYTSVQDSTNVDPVSDADNSHWRRIWPPDYNDKFRVAVGNNQTGAISASLTAPQIVELHNVNHVRPAAHVIRLATNRIETRLRPLAVAISDIANGAQSEPYPEVYTGGYFGGLRLHATGSTNLYSNNAPIYVTWNSTDGEFQFTPEAQEIGAPVGIALFADAADNGLYDVVLDFGFLALAASQFSPAAVGRIDLVPTVPVFYGRGVSSVTDQGVGDVRVNHETRIDENYRTVVTGIEDVQGRIEYTDAGQTSMDLNVYSSAGTPRDAKIAFALYGRVNPAP